VVMFAMQQTEKGVRAIARSKFREALKETFPSVSYPSQNGPTEVKS
jgi:hypothetical protein